MKSPAVRHPDRAMARCSSARSHRLLVSEQGTPGAKLSRHLRISVADVIQAIDGPSRLRRSNENNDCEQYASAAFATDLADPGGTWGRWAPVSLGDGAGQGAPKCGRSMRNLMSSI